MALPAFMVKEKKFCEYFIREYFYRSHLKLSHENLQAEKKEKHSCKPKSAVCLLRYKIKYFKYG